MKSVASLGEIQMREKQEKRRFDLLFLLPFYWYYIDMSYRETRSTILYRSNTYEYILNVTTRTPVLIITCQRLNIVLLIHSSYRRILSMSNNYCYAFGIFKFRTIWSSWFYLWLDVAFFISCTLKMNLCLKCNEWLKYSYRAVIYARIKSLVHSLSIDL